MGFVNGIFPLFLKLPLVNDLNFINGVNGQFSFVITELKILWTDHEMLKAQPLKVYYSIDSVNGAKHKKTN